MARSDVMTPGEDDTRVTSAPADPRDRHLFDERPWGRFDQFTQNEASTVKIITVEPGQRLSLQRHARRGEYWVIIDGPVEVTVDDATWAAATGEKVWVPVGAVHRLGNPGATAVRILEIGFGDFDEADIERLEDDYSR